MASPSATLLMGAALSFVIVTMMVTQHNHPPAMPPTPSPQPTPTPTPAPKPTRTSPHSTQTASDSSVSVSSLVSKPVVWSGPYDPSHPQQDRVLQVLLKIAAPALSSQVARPPLELAVVLDRSGSMAGDKLQHSKAALIDLVNSMQDDDIMHLIQYDDRAQVVYSYMGASYADKQHMRQLIDRIDIGGMTNLYEGLQVAYQQLQSKEYHANMNINRVKRVFLFSDGLANVGTTDHNAIATGVANMLNHGVTVSTFGVGSSFDEVLMKRIAESGGGNYMYIASAGSIQNIVQYAMKGMSSLLGTEAILKLSSANPYVTITKVYARTHHELVHGIQLNDLLSGDERKLLVEVSIGPDFHSSSAASLQLFEWLLVYKSTKEPVGELVTTRGAVTVDLSTDRAACERVNEEVTAYTKFHRIMEDDGSFERNIETGNVNAAYEQKAQQQASLNALQEEFDAGVVEQLSAELQSAVTNTRIAKEAVKTDGNKAKKTNHFYGSQMSAGSAAMYRVNPDM